MCHVTRRLSTPCQSCKQTFALVTALVLHDRGMQ